MGGRASAGGASKVEQTEQGGWSVYTTLALQWCRQTDRAVEDHAETLEDEKICSIDKIALFWCDSLVCN